MGKLPPDMIAVLGHRSFFSLGSASVAAMHAPFSTDPLLPGKMRLKAVIWAYDWNSVRP